MKVQEKENHPMRHYNKHVSKLFLGVLVLILCFLITLVHPVWVFERQTQFCLEDAKLREASYLLGLRICATEEQTTPVSRYLPTTPSSNAERKWVLVRRRGVLFPMDLLKLDQHETLRYGAIVLDVGILESIWTRRSDMSVEEKQDMAARYMSYLRKGRPNDATAWLSSILEEDLRRPGVEKKGDAQ